MIIACEFGTGVRTELTIDTTLTHDVGRQLIRIALPNAAVYLDENHAEALEMALRAARLEVQARAVSR